VAGIPAFAFGLAEDLTKCVSVTQRLLLATMSSGVLAWALTGYALTGVNVLGLDWLLQFTVVSVLFTAFAVGGVANAINIIDGLNGLASSKVLWDLLGVAMLAATLGDTVLASTCLLLAACVLLVERHDNVSAFDAMLFCIHPVVEVFYSVYRRKVRHQNPGHPDRLHFHSLFKRRFMQRLIPHSSKTIHNSMGGFFCRGHEPAARCARAVCLQQHPGQHSRRAGAERGLCVAVQAHGVAVWSLIWRADPVHQRFRAA